VRVAISVDGVQGNWNTVDFAFTPDRAWFVVTRYASNLINTGDFNDWANGAPTSSPSNRSRTASSASV